jgi:hypothetical protein
MFSCLYEFVVAAIGIRKMPASEDRKASTCDERTTVILRFRPEKAEFWHRFSIIETQSMRSE